MSRFRTDGISGGRRRQSAVAQRGGKSRDHVLRAHGLNLRAVVRTTYLQLDGTRAFPDDAVQLNEITAVYCDVIVYSSIEGYRNGPLARVPVMQHIGMHAGHVWTPRPSTVDVSTGAYDPATSDPMNLDGDHVRVEFLEDDLGRPIITGRIPHPRMGQGNEQLVEVGHRLKMKTADGLVEFWKHQGTFFGVDKQGNFIIDTTRAHDGQVSVNGAEVPKNDTDHGHVRLKIGNGVKVTVVDADNRNLLELDPDGSTAVVKLGPGTSFGVKYDELKAQLEDIIAKFNGHTHPDGWGSTAVTTTLMTAFDAAMKAANLKIPSES